MKPVRTRFAPSPTGFLHVGGVRTALFAWLLARQNNGQFILRLEDTDKAREVDGSSTHIEDSLRWLGITWDEGPDIGGPLGPYKQSDRLEIYKEWAIKLVDAGHAYPDPFTSEQVNKFREEAKNAKQPFLFRNHRPEIAQKWDGQTPLRFKSTPKNYSWYDAVLGDLSAGPEVIDDFIIIKSDGYPTYNFAHIIDDHLMEISHVIRSQEFTASVPKFLNLYEALGFEAPILATLPFVMGPDGKKKLSKRDGAKDILDYARDGYLPESLISFLATLGWNDGTEQEIFTVQELLDKFSLDKVQKSGARFDEKRLLWINGTLIRKQSLDDLYALTESYWPEEAKTVDLKYKKQVLSLVQERLKYLNELPELTSFFFKDLPINLELINNNKDLSKLSRDKLIKILKQVHEKLRESEFNTEAISESLNQLLVEMGQKPKVLFSLIRISTTHTPSSPGLAESLAILGKETTLRRINETIAAI